jgi:formamidopyrimidine-DNA glycosylase
MKKRGGVCIKCGKSIEEEVCNIVNQNRPRYYCNNCLAKIFKFDKKL